MGLAASQARLLSITSRMSDTELRSQLINNAKMRLTTDSAKVSDEYIAALNQTQMMFTNFDTAGNERYQNLTFNALTAYSSYNTQYGVVNNNGQLMVSSLDAANFVASGQDVNEFLRLYGLEQRTTYWDTLAASDEYNTYGVGYYDDLGVWQRLDVADVATLQAMYEGTPDAMGIAHYGLDPSFNSVEYETYEVLRGEYVAAKRAYNAELQRVSNNYLSAQGDYASTEIKHAAWVDWDQDNPGVSTYDYATLYTYQTPDYGFDAAYENVSIFIGDAQSFIGALDEWAGHNYSSSYKPAIQSHDFIGITNAGYLNFNIFGYTVNIGNAANFDFDGGQLGGHHDSCLGIYRLLNAYMDSLYDTFQMLHVSQGTFNNTFNVTNGSDSGSANFHYADLHESSIGTSSCMLGDNDIARTFIANYNALIRQLQDEIDESYHCTTHQDNPYDVFVHPGPYNNSGYSDPDDWVGESSHDIYNSAGELIGCSPEGCQEHLCNALELLGELYELLKNDLPAALDEEKLRAQYPDLQTLFDKYQDASENLARFIWGGSSPADTTSPGHQIYSEMFGANAQYKYYEHLDDPAWILSTYNEYPPDTGIVVGSPHENPYYMQYPTTTTYDGLDVPLQDYKFYEVDPATGTEVAVLRPMSTSYQAVRDILLLQCLLEHYGEPKYTWIDINNPDEDAEAKVRWYTNLFNRMLQGYQTLDPGLENSADWLQFAFESGLVHMEQVNSYDQWVALMYSNCTGITESTKDVDITLAEAKYKREMAKIEAKDKRYDMELKTLDTEHESLKQEYEQIKKVIQKNIDRNMKMFQMG